MALTVRVASDAEKRARDEVTYAAWGERLTLAQYLAREARLRAHPWAKAGMETWLLCDGETTVSSCESFSMDSRAGDTRGASYGIASVFTEEKFRGKRYATELVDRVSGALLAREGSHAVVLYSDVGAPIYERAGFVYTPRLEWWIAAAGHAPIDGLRLDDVIAVHRVPPPTATQLVIVPSPAQLDWHHARERYYAEARNRRAPARHRLVYGEDQVIVAADLKNGELLVLSAEWSAATVEVLLRGAADLAWQLGLAGVRLWAPDAIAPPAFVATKPLESSLPMIRSAPSCAFVWCDVQRGVWV